MADLGTPIFAETAWAHGFARVPRGFGGVGTHRLVRVAAPLHELTVTTYTGHGIGHTYRDDVPLLPLTGPQAGWQ